MRATVAVNNSDTVLSSTCRFLLKPGLFKHFGDRSICGTLEGKMTRKVEFVRLERKLLRAVCNNCEHNGGREVYPVRIKPKPTDIQN